MRICDTAAGAVRADRAALQRPSLRATGAADIDRRAEPRAELRPGREGLPREGPRVGDHRQRPERRGAGVSAALR